MSKRQSSVFDDSQEEGDLSQRDLFAEALSSEQDPGHYAQGIPQNVGNEILKTLMKLEKNLEGVMKDVAALKRQQNDGAFSMETCTFKKRLNVFLKEKFSRCPWLKTQSDLEFKNEVRKCLKQDNFQTNTLAYRSVNQWATTRFTEYRNQLRRKLMSDIKNGKDVQAMPLQEFCKTYLESYASSASVDVGDSPERIQVSLVLRSFTHSQKLNVEGSDELEFFTDFWAKVMEYYDEVTKKDDERKWDKLKMLDNRRMTQRQAAQQPGGEGHDVFAKLLLGNVELKYSGTQTELPGQKSGNTETEEMDIEETSVVGTANLELSIKEDMREEILQGNYKMKIAPSDLVDFGGQKSYDMTHQLFIQCKGTFVLMFDGRYGLYDALEEYKPHEITTISILVHWIDSILTYCVDESIEEHKLPKIVFAATHGDFYTQDELNKRKAMFIDELTKTFSSNDLHEHIIYQTVFFFDARNEHDSELQKLTKHLVDIAFAQPSWGQQMPVAWVPLELQISKMKTARMNFVRKSELQKINTQNGDLALSNSQFDHFLKVQHSLGKLMYFGDHGIDNFIVIQPSAFVNVLRSFVTDEMFWPKDEEVINILPILSKTGVLQRNGLYKLWEQKHFEQLVPTDDLKKYIIDVLIHLDILVEPKRYRGAEKSAEFFLVPCMIKEKAPTAFLNLEEMADKMICMSYRLKRSSVPAALIFKLIGSALNVLPIKETDGRPCLYYQAATFSIDDNNECRIHMKGSRIVVNLLNKVSRLEISPDIAASIQECLTLTLTNVLHFYYACMGNDIKKVDISKFFESEVGVLCGKELCFIPVDEAMKRKTWTCEKEKIHETQLHWILDENIGQDECRPGCDGISAKDLCRSPNDKHLVGLASELNIKNFHEFILHLGLKTKDWDQIGYNWGRAEDAKVVALLQWKERNEIVTFEKLLDAQACIGDNQHHLCKVFKGQTGLLENTSFKYLDTPEDIFLSTLSRKLGNCVIQLGIELGLTFSDIEAVFVRHPNDLFSQMYEVLKIWKQKTQENTYHNLMIAIQRVKGKQFIKRNFCCNM